MSLSSDTDLVESFLAELRRALSTASASLQEVPRAASGLRRFAVPEASLETSLTLFPTPRSSLLPFGEYRVIASTKLPAGAEEELLRRDPGLDGFATLGAIHRHGRSVSSSMLIEPSSPGTLAGILATSLLHTGPSVLDHLQRRQEPEAPSAPASPSAWSDLDLAQLHFDLGHRIGCSLAPGEWRQTLGPMSLSLTIEDHHPYFGGGLLSRVSVPAELFIVDGVAVPVPDLNTETMLATEEPAFGAWTTDANGYCFLSFLPNSLQQLPEFEEHWASWSLRRAAGAIRIAQTAHATWLGAEPAAEEDTSDSRLWHHGHSDSAEELRPGERQGPGFVPGFRFPSSPAAGEAGATFPEGHLVAFFLAELRFWLQEFFGASLKEVPSNNPTARNFAVPNAEHSMTLVVPPPSDMDGILETECHMVAKIMLPAEAGKLLTRSGRDPNQFATLGIVTAGAVSLAVHGIIRHDNLKPLAAMTAVAMMQAAPSVLEFLRSAQKPTPFTALRRLFTRQQEAQPTPHSPSAWTSRELERLHVDNARHGSSSLGERSWTLRLPVGVEVATLSLTSIDDHPHFGGGLLSQLHLPRAVLTIDGHPVTAMQLNGVEFLTGEEPTFGAWVDDADGCSFQSFLPNILQPVTGFDHHWVGWSIKRATGAEVLARSYRQIFGGT
ncbi:hypothetical protein GXW71_18615 [Roseomonas hellenica]|uniref:Uncharacterized protein n=1 Tax=Plastoroseomonas hellenica TaxID=2687306 RepID=A0ABS5F1E5_9PROT|nr:hypothetical protein [Plastoroseomonas hellenica]MBR0666380.1 hypothetical protein [Plastoroseomonas hellenica]